MTRVPFYPILYPTMKRNLIHIVYPAEFSMTYAVTSDDDTSITSLLEQAFAAWNHGSDQECAQFLDSRKRSMCVGDYVGVNGQFYRCEPMGWTGVTWQQVLDFEAKVAAHEDYGHHGAWFAMQCLLQEENDLACQFTEQVA